MVPAVPTPPDNTEYAFMRPNTPLITSPSDGTLTAESYLVVSGTADPGTNVELFDWTALVGTATVDVAGNWQIALQVSSLEGHIYRARAVDGQKRKSPHSDQCVVSITSDKSKNALPVRAIGKKWIRQDRSTRLIFVVAALILICTCAFLLLRLTGFQSTSSKSAPLVRSFQRAADWYVPAVQGHFDQALLVLSSPNQTPVSVQINTVGSHHSIRLHVRSGIELALRGDSRARAIIIHAAAPITVQRLVVKGTTVLKEHGRPISTAKGKPAR
jgi:Bacterial Ig domain